MQRPRTGVGRSGRPSRTGARAARSAPSRRPIDDGLGTAPALVSAPLGLAPVTPLAVGDGTSLRNQSNQVVLRARSLFGKVQALRDALDPKLAR